jgi:hypothetical protein
LVDPPPCLVGERDSGASGAGADPFTAFGWKVLNDITNGMIAMGYRPNLVQLRRYVEGGPDGLLQRPEGARHSTRQGLGESGHHRHTDLCDFAGRLGDESKARQVLANTNLKIALRVLDSETQKYLADGMPQIKVRLMALRYGHQVDPRVQAEDTASHQKQILEEEAEIFPAAMLGELPPLHFLARLSGGRTLKGRIPILMVPALTERAGKPPRAPSSPSRSSPGSQPPGRCSRQRRYAAPGLPSGQGGTR